MDFGWDASLRLPLPLGSFGLSQSAGSPVSHPNLRPAIGVGAPLRLVRLHLYLASDWRGAGSFLFWEQAYAEWRVFGDRRQAGGGGEIQFVCILRFHLSILRRSIVRLKE